MQGKKILIGVLKAMAPASLGALGVAVWALSPEGYTAFCMAH